MCKLGDITYKDVNPELTGQSNRTILRRDTEKVSATDGLIAQVIVTQVDWSNPKRIALLEKESEMKT